MLRHASLPNVVERGLGDLLLRRVVILVGAFDGAVDDDEARLARARHRRDLRHVDVLIARVLAPARRGRRYRLHPAAVEPEDIDGAVVAHQFLDLIVSEGLEPLPALGGTGDLSVSPVSNMQKPSWCFVVKTT